MLNKWRGSLPRTHARCSSWHFSSCWRQALTGVPLSHTYPRAGSLTPVPRPPKLTPCCRSGSIRGIPIWFFCCRAPLALALQRPGRSGPPSPLPWLANQTSKGWPPIGPSPRPPGPGSSAGTVYPPWSTAHVLGSDNVTPKRGAALAARFDVRETG